MPLTDEIKQVAEDLGRQLGAEADVQEYIILENQAQTNPEVAALEAKYTKLYQNLLTRQQNGEQLEQSEVDEFYRLKREIQSNPLITARDYQLVLVKTLFAQTAQQITEALGIDYPSYAG